MKALYSLILVFALQFTLQSVAQAQYRQVSASSRPTFTYDVGGSVGNYNGTSYSEVNLGLNWHFNDYLTWRNAVFSRFGSEQASASGLDTSMRFDYGLQSQGGSLGFNVFAGPGYRFSKNEYSAAFAEAGLTVKLGGLNIGGGAKLMNYTSPGTASDGSNLPKNDVTYFIILAGGGAF